MFVTNFKLTLHSEYVRPEDRQVSEVVPKVKSKLPTCDQTN